VQYVVAAGVSVLAAGLSLLLAPLLEPRDFALSLGAVMLSAWYGGLGPGLFHDETGQLLTSLLVGLRSVQDAGTLQAAQEGAAELRRIATRTLDEVRRLAWGLRPSALDELGLVPALEHYATEYGQSQGITVHVQARGLDRTRLLAPVEITLYRIVQEALTNTAKHAKAESVSIVIQRHPSWVQVIVADDGCGFDVDAALRAPGNWTHLGLHGMRERAALLEGSVTIESAPGEGTTIYARIPLPGNDASRSSAVCS